MLLINKINDLPAWFYLDNPNVKNILLKTPSKEEREALVKGANFPSFFAGDIYAEENGFYQEYAKTLAEKLFGDERSCIRFDMSEYGQSHSDQKLLGAPPGYVGYEAGGQLTNAVKHNPFSILLFDEIEKAHPSILDKFLQILEDGRMTDGQGNTVYFSETIIIFTSNLGIYDTNRMGERVQKVNLLILFLDICLIMKYLGIKKS